MKKMNKIYEAPAAEVIEMVNNTAVLMITGGNQPNMPNGDSN
jgi:hypothetical protein